MPVAFQGALAEIWIQSAEMGPKLGPYSQASPPPPRNDFTFHVPLSLHCLQYNEALQLVLSCSQEVDEGEKALGWKGKGGGGQSRSRAPSPIQSTKLSCTSLPGAVCATPPPGLLQSPLRGDRREQAAEAGCASEGSLPLQRPAGGECGSQERAQPEVLST